MKILHLSQTDIKSDSRILKEMHSLKKGIPNAKLFGIGVEMSSGASKTSELSELNIDSITLKSRNLNILPKTIRQGLSVTEITAKMLLKSLKIKPHVIHCHDTPSLPLALTVKLFTGAKLIYDAHELESDRNRISKLSSKLTLFVEKILWRYIDAQIIVSPSIENWYENNIGKKTSEVILNSPSLAKNDTCFDSSYFNNYFSIPSSSRVFLYIGVLAPGRGINKIASIFKKYDIKSHLVFLGYGELSDSLKVLSKQHPNIHVHDAVPHKKVVTIAKSADIGLCLIEKISLSDYYCLPNKLFEYCFSGIPVLASDFPDISQVVKDYDLGKCTKLDPDSIYQSIKELEKLETLPKIDTGALYDLSWDAQEKKLIKLYNVLTEK